MSRFLWTAPKAPALAAAVAGLFFTQSALEAQPSAIEGDAERGSELYERFGCHACHLYSGAGYQGAPGGAPLVPMRLNREAFMVYLRNPAVPRRMPPYTQKVLSVEQAGDIYAFIRSLPAPRNPRDIPQLEAIIDEIEAAGGQ